MRTAGRIAWVIGAIALVLTVLLGLLPTRGRAIVGFLPPGMEITGEADCGSEFRFTKWRHADGCDGPILTRTGLVVLFGLIGVATSITAAGLWSAESRRRTGSGNDTVRCSMGRRAGMP